MNPYESGAVIDMNMGHNSATPAALQSLLSFAPQLGSCDTPEPSLSALIYRYYRTHVDDRASADAMARDYVRALADAAPQPAVQQGEPLAWMDDGTLRAGSEATAYRVVTDATKRGMTASLAASFITPLYAHPAAPAAQGDALTDTYVQQVPDKCDRIVWRGRYYHLPIDAAEHSYTEPSPMAKVAAALRQKAEQEDAAYQARRSDQGLMESEWGPMEDAPPHEDPPMHVAVVEGDDAVRTLQWNRDVAAFAYPVGTLLYAARSQAKEGA